MNETCFTCKKVSIEENHPIGCDGCNNGYCSEECAGIEDVSTFIHGGPAIGVWYCKHCLKKQEVYRDAYQQGRLYWDQENFGK